MEDIRIYAKCECGHDEFKLVVYKKGSLYIQATECVECETYQEYVIKTEESHKLDS